MRKIKGILILENEYDYNACDVIYNHISTDDNRRSIRLKNVGVIKIPCNAEYPLYLKMDDYYDPHCCAIYSPIDSTKAKEILAAYALDLREKAHEIEVLIGNWQIAQKFVLIFMQLVIDKKLKRLYNKYRR